MKASELYNQTSAEVDKLQKQLHNHVRDQLSISSDIVFLQTKMKALASIIIKQGDRALTENELMPAGPLTGTQSDVALYMAKAKGV